MAGRYYLLVWLFFPHSELIAHLINHAETFINLYRLLQAKVRVVIRGIDPEKKSGWVGTKEYCSFSTNQY